MTDTGSMTIEEALVHFGVKGMKWGTRKRVSGGEIRTARANVKSMRRDIRNQRKVVRKASTPEKKAAAKTKLTHMKVKMLNHPDHATAMRMTKGEVAFHDAILSPAWAGTTVAAAVGSRKLVERYQKTGAYNKAYGVGR